MIDDSFVYSDFWLLPMNTIVYLVFLGKNQTVIPRAWKKGKAMLFS